METEQTPTEQIRAIRNKVKALLKHEERKLEKQEAEAEEAGQYGRYGQIADSLMADPSAAPRGTAKSAIINIHTSEIEEIALNPAFDAVENAELLYRKARRGKRGHETATAMMTETEARIGRLKYVIAGIDDTIKNPGADNSPVPVRQSAETDGNSSDNSHRHSRVPAGSSAANRPPEFTGDDVARVREIAAEFIPPVILNACGKPKKEPPPPPFKKYVIDGWEVYLGKNSEQNDELSTRFAKPSDIWLHVAAHAGSHVIIRHQKNTDNPPRTVIEKAAQIAVWHSKARHTSYAEVHVTEARFVRKRRHAPPGEVIAERCKAVRVEPKDPRDILGG